MYVVLAAVLLALGAFTALVAARIGSSSGGGMDPQQVRGFCYVGAIAAGTVALAVWIIGLLIRNTPLADGVALLALFGYFAYFLAALVINTWPAGRWPRR